jgi:hypothetical protein
MMGTSGDLAGSWFEQGVWLGEHHYDCLDALGAHFRADHDQEFVVYGVESLNGHRPIISAIRNFTEMKDFRIPVAGHCQVGQAHNWRYTVGTNLPRIEHNWGDAPDVENVIYVGSGPSLKKNWQDLKLVDRSRCEIWAANEAFSFLLSKGIHADRFFCIDATSPKRWWDGLDCSRTSLVAAPFVNPEVLDANWREALWFNIAGEGAYYNMVRDRHPELLEVDATRGVGSAMIESSWFKKVKRIALLGSDFCYEREGDKVYRSVWHYWEKDEWQKISVRHLHYVVNTLDGGHSVTYIGLALECGAVFGAAQCLREKGVEVINASEGGCLFVNPAARYLQDKPPVLTHKPLRECVDFLHQEA